jgi:hypothetical protein
MESIRNCQVPFYRWKRASGLKTVNCISCNNICTSEYTECPTRYRTRHFFNNFTTNEDIATKFEANLPNCVQNVKEKNVTMFKFCCNIFIGVRIIKEMPGLVASGTPCRNTLHLQRNLIFWCFELFLFEGIYCTNLWSISKNLEKNSVEGFLKLLKFLL